MFNNLTICSRKSNLAMVQTNYVKDLISKNNPKISVDIIGLSTRGDEILDKSLAKIGGKGLFIKELEVCMQDGKADFAVHSMKDLPYALPENFVIASVLERECPQDVLISNNDISFFDLPKGAVIGTSSLRRQTQLKLLRDDLNFKFIRGNIETRLNKLATGEYDAIVLAAAGLIRTGKEDLITEYFSTDQIIPAVGQGALALECLTEKVELITFLRSFANKDTTICTFAERAFNAKLEGSCQLPVACYANINGGELVINAIVSSPDAKRVVKDSICGPKHDYLQLGQTLADRMLDNGAGQIIESL